MALPAKSGLSRLRLGRFVQLVSVACATRGLAASPLRDQVHGRGVKSADTRPPLCSRRAVYRGTQGWAEQRQQSAASRSWSRFLWPHRPSLCSLTKPSWWRVLSKPAGCQTSAPQRSWPTSRHNPPQRARCHQQWRPPPRPQRRTQATSRGSGDDTLFLVRGQVQLAR